MLTCKKHWGLLHHEKKFLNGFLNKVVGAVDLVVLHVDDEVAVGRNYHVVGAPEQVLDFYNKMMFLGLNQVYY
jgi:hypothetical protein